MDENVALHNAREAIARGNLQAARQLLAQVLHEEPGNEAAWMMMATAVDQPDQERDCLQRVLRINPDNEAARERLAALNVPQPAPSPPSEEPPAEGERQVPAPATEAEPPERDSELAASEEGRASVSTPVEAIAPPGATPASEDAAVAAGYGAVPDAAPVSVEATAEPLAAPVGEPVPEAQAEPVSRPAPAAAPGAVAADSSFLAETLAPGEVVVHRTTLSLSVFVRPIAVVLGAAILLLLPSGDLDARLVLAIDALLLTIAFVYFGLRAIRYFGSEYAVTDRRVLARRGLLARLAVDIPLSEIEEVTVARGLFRSSPTAGNVWIRRADRTTTMFWRIRQPQAFREAIERQREALQEDGETRSF